MTSLLHITTMSCTNYLIWVISQWYSRKWVTTLQAFSTQNWYHTITWDHTLYCISCTYSVQRNSELFSNAHDRYRNWCADVWSGNLDAAVLQRNCGQPFTVNRVLLHPFANFSHALYAERTCPDQIWRGWPFELYNAAICSSNSEPCR